MPACRAATPPRVTNPVPRPYGSLAEAAAILGADSCVHLRAKRGWWTSFPLFLVESPEAHAVSALAAELIQSRRHARLRRSCAEPGALDGTRALRGTRRSPETKLMRSNRRDQDSDHLSGDRLRHVCSDLCTNGSDRHVAGTRRRWATLSLGSCSQRGRAQAYGLGKFLRVAASGNLRRPH